MVAELEAAASGSSTADSETLVDSELSTSTDADAEESVSEGTDSRQKPLHEIPRFKEVISERNEAISALRGFESEKEVLNKQIAELHDRNLKLIDIMEAKENDASTMNQIRDLANDADTDERVVGAIELLDKALKGEIEAVQEEAEQKVNSGDLTRAEARKMINEHVSEMELRVDQQRADMITEQVNVRADEFLKALPDEYNDVDREIVSELWAKRLDWEALNSDPSQMMDVLSTSFESAIEKYGMPKGAQTAVVNEASEEGGNSVKEPSADEVLERIKAINWGDTSGDGSSKKPVYDDEFFSKQMANVMKLSKADRG